ncbi:MAG TPA: hypothetical protein VE643_10005 [Nitrososphaeraceae archaeon]|nr:hypothetical protein [Nitrososphaeraceae archaeon]
MIDLICDICREKLDPTDPFAFEAFAYYFDGMIIITVREWQR